MPSFTSPLKKMLLLLTLNTTLSTKINNYSDLHLCRRLVIIAEISHILLRTAKRKDGLLLIIFHRLLYNKQDFNNILGILILILNHMHQLPNITIMLILS